MLYTLKRRYWICIVIAVIGSVHFGSDGVMLGPRTARRRFGPDRKRGCYDQLWTAPRLCHGRGISRSPPPEQRWYNQRWDIASLERALAMVALDDLDHKDSRSSGGPGAGGRDSFGKHDYLHATCVGQGRVPGPRDPTVRLNGYEGEYAGAPHGTHWRIESMNVGGLRQKLPSLLSAGAEICIIQEADIDEKYVAEATSAAEAAGFYLRFGASTNLDRYGWRKGRRVAILSKLAPVDNLAEEVLTDPTLDYLHTSGRWTEAAFDAGEGTQVRVAALYGVSGSSSNVAKRNTTQRLHAAALSRADCFKTIPYLIGADSNVAPETLPAVAAAKARDIAHDLLGDCFTGGPLPNTFRRGGVHVGMYGPYITRPDALFANRTAASAADMLQLQYSAAIDRGADHVPIVVLLNTRRKPEHITIAVQPRRLQFPDLATMKNKE